MQKNHQELKRSQSNHLVRPATEKLRNHDLEFYISRYPFPKGSIAFQTKFYKTFYECESFQLSNAEILRLTSLNRLPSLVKLKQIVKSISKPAFSHAKQTANVFIHCYSLCYEVVPYFILSPLGISLVRSMMSQSERRKLFDCVIQDIQFLITSNVFYLLDVQNIGITMTRQVKFYIPANNIVEEVIFTEKHSKKMRLAANIVIQCIKSNLENPAASNNFIDVEMVKNQIKEQLLKLQQTSNMKQSQTFTFNQNLQNKADKSPEAQLNDLDKNSNIRKQSQTISFIPQINLKKLQKTKCETTREYGHRKEEAVNNKVARQVQKKENQLRDLFDQNTKKQNALLKQRMKQYEQRFIVLNNTVKQMKEEMIEMKKKERYSLPKKPIQDRVRQRSLTELNKINESSYKDISFLAQKTCNSRVEIENFLHDLTDLRHSYHLEQKNDCSHFMLNKQLDNAIKDYSKQNDEVNQSRDQKQTSKKTQKTTQKVKISSGPKILPNLRSYLQISKLDEIIQEKSNAKSNNNGINSNYNDQEVSIIKQTPMEDSPFRQYGNFRIEYVVDEKNNSNNQQQKQNEVTGHIKVHPEPVVQPFKIIRSPVKNRLLYPLVSLREPFRYSCLSIAKNFLPSYGYITIPQNIYDPTEYDSVDTFEMELGGRECIMPKIVSSSAFRHTLFPSSLLGKIKPTKDVEMSKEKSNDSQSQTKKNWIHQSAGNRAFRKYTQHFIDKDQQFYQKEALSQKSQKKLNQTPQQIPQIIMTEIPKTPIVVQKQPIAQNSLSKHKKTHQICHGETTQIEENQKEKKRQKQQQRLSKTNKNASKIIKHQLDEEKKQEKEILVGMYSRIQTRKFDQQKVEAVLSRSKQIISKYQNLLKKKH